jgi:hypothetical protein
VRKALEKIVAFVIPGTVFIVTVDTPTKDAIRDKIEYWHQDQITFASSRFKDIDGKIVYTNRLFGDLATSQSDYTCIEYGDDHECISTSVRRIQNKKAVEGSELRFLACQGTVICVDNNIQEHSTPHDMENTKVDETITFDRSAGNLIVSKSTGRDLYRTQFLAVVESVWNTVVKNFNDLLVNQISEFDFNDEDNAICRRESFQKMSLQDYIANEKKTGYPQLGGGVQAVAAKRKRRTHKRGSARKQRTRKQLRRRFSRKR